MKKTFLLFNLLILLFAAQYAYSQAKTGVFNMSYTENGTGAIRTFYMDVPTDYDSTKSYPLLFAWHGAGMPGSDMLANMQGLNTSIKAIICCPDVNGMTIGSQLATMFQTALQYVEKYNLDNSRKVITGFSMGGNYAFQIGLVDPTKFHGIIGFSPATGASQFSTDMWNNIKKIRMATIEGTLDFNWSVVNALMLDIQSRGANLLYIVKQNVTHADNVYFSSTEFKNDYQSCYNYVIGLTSVKDNQITDNLNMQVYPNPFTGKTEIEVGKTDGKPLNISVYDLYGKKVYEELRSSLNQDEHIPLNLGNIPDGIYMLRILDGSHTGLQKIIKQH